MRDDVHKLIIPHPLKVQIHPSTRCNLNCNFCWLHETHLRYKELSNRRWLQIADDLVELEPRLITLSGGGEPLVRLRLVLKMMDLFSRKGIPGQLITNGTLIDKEVAEILVSCGWEDVILSIQATGQLDGKIRGNPRAFRLSERGIAHINAWKEKLGSPVPALSVMTVLARDNCLALPALIEFCNSAGVGTLTARLVNTSKGGTPASVEILPEQHQRLWESIQLAKEVAQDASVSLALEFDENQFLPKSGNTRQGDVQQVKSPERPQASMADTGGPRTAKRAEPLCPLPFYEMVIFAGGKVGGCCSFFNPYAWEVGYVGDASKTSVKMIWRHGLSALRRSMLGGDLCPTCKACSEDLCFHTGRWPEWYWETEFTYLRSRKRYEEALALGGEQLGKFPNHPLLHYFIGRVHMDTQDFQKAIEHLRCSVQHNPSDVKCRMKLAESYFRLGRLKQAEQAFRRVLDSGKEPGMMMHSWFSLALIGTLQKRDSLFEESMDALQGFEECLYAINEDEREFLHSLRRNGKLPGWLKNRFPSR